MCSGPMCRSELLLTSVGTRRVVLCWPLPLLDLPHLPPGAPTLCSPPSSSSNSSSNSGGRRSAAGRWALVTASCDPPGARSTRSGAITPWARWRGGAAELSWPGRGRLYPRPEPQEAAPLPRRGWHGGGHVGGGLQRESLPHPCFTRPGLPWGPLSLPARTAGLDSSPCTP